VENRVLASPTSVMRVASISKCLTAAAAAKLVESGKLDLDRPVRDYVKSWPESQPEMTPRQLLSHLSGVRHYWKKDEAEATPKPDGECQEFLSKEKYDAVEKALDIFKDDELLCKPGNLSCHGNAPDVLSTEELWLFVTLTVKNRISLGFPIIICIPCSRF
jgi:serine beta-lactamase-like protein LACTB